MNEIITEAVFRKQLGKTAGHAYILFGGEDYLKSHAVRAVREDVCPEPAFAVFNDITIDVADYTPEGLINAMSAPPMMTEGKLIVLRGLDFTAMRAEEIDELCEVLSLISEYDFNTVLVYVAAGLIDEGYAKKPSTVLKKLSEVATPVRFEPATDAKLAAWGAKHFAHLGVQASPDVCRFLVAYVGQSMFVLAAEIEKLAYFALAHGRDQITEADVRLVAVPQLSADTFAMSNALLSGNYRAALDALAVMKFQCIEPMIVMGELSRTFCDMQAAKLLVDAGRTVADVMSVLKIRSEWKAGNYCRAVSRTTAARLARAVELCAVADAQIKRSYGDYTPIEKLICSL